MKAPIVLFVYNRPLHTQKTLDALAINPEAIESELYIFCDGPKSKPDDLIQINQVKNIVTTESRFKKVNLVIHKKNKGLADSIIEGVTEIVNKHSRIIVIEDDIVVTEGFLKYMNNALDLFENKKEVFHINGFNNESNLQFLLNDYYFLNFMSCWGWGTWKDRWNKITLDHNYFYDKLTNDQSAMSDFNYDDTLGFHNQLDANIKGEIKTWAILWFSTVYFNKGLCLTPKYSFVNNIGMDGSGINCEKNTLYEKIYFKVNTPLEVAFGKLKYTELFLARLHLKLFFKYGSKFNLFNKSKKQLMLIKRLLVKLKKKFIKSPYECKTNIPKKWYGNDYGGFFICPNTLNENSVVYSFGIGEDISFDLDVINNHKSNVFAFDPTPKSIDWVKKQNGNDNFNFYDFGVDTINGNKCFNLPLNKDHVSGSVFDGGHLIRANPITVQMKRVKTIMNDLGHDYVDVLKMDIEGSEYEVLDDILDSKVQIGQIVVEFHDRFFVEPNKSFRIMKKLKANGFLLFGVSDSKEELSFINKKMFSKIHS